ncbi:hypothetical protein J422_06436 [Methanocaldococcus villosus KIN24-T80]|uniref:Ribosomal L11 methyltransferase n=1 Tax=Methanocaldococcus villosus KIN24-T80 TaxID=1069083 RepID=N6VX62_9EURY|nr:50S ribosomal protein L11 methyltransferase [Methanocaldococcus villosus]ENN95702.1 hypothetical protein J422_06436 [Methanocaldococcus villosus KIN24-T80]
MILELDAPQWHLSLLHDYERIAIYKKAIEENVKESDIVFDLGTGSGILAMIAALKAKRVYAIELDSFTYEYAKENIKRNGFDNIILIEGDAELYNFKENPDVIVAELLDTALIAESHVRVMNAMIKKGYINDNTKLIPKGVINTVQLVEAKFNHIYYDEKSEAKPLSEEMIYEEVSFYKINPLKMKYKFKFHLDEDYNNVGLRLKTYTILDDKHVAGPTPMLNPPLVIPVGRAKRGDLLIKLFYERGVFESIKVRAYDL